MLFHCEFTWFPDTTRDDVAKRVAKQFQAGAADVDRVRGWYNLAGDGGGYMILDFDSVPELTAFLQPYTDLMSFDVRAISELKYDEHLHELQSDAGS